MNNEDQDTFGMHKATSGGELAPDPRPPAGGAEIMGAPTPYGIGAITTSLPRTSVARSRPLHFPNRPIPEPADSWEAIDVCASTAC